MNKIRDISESISLIENGSRIMVGGFMGVGCPDALISEIINQNKANLCLISSDTATPDKGVGRLISAGLVDKVIASHIGTNPYLQQKMLDSEIEVELYPQGTLVEKIRSGGSGIAGFLVDVGVDTLAAKGKQVISLDGQDYLLEKGILADHALISADQSDIYGNLRFRLAGRNFNPIMALAGKNVIAEVRETLPLGGLQPDDIHTPSCLVNSIVVSG